MINKLLVPCGAFGTPIYSFIYWEITDRMVCWIGLAIPTMCQKHDCLWYIGIGYGGEAFSIMYYTRMYINVVNFRQNLNGKALFMSRLFCLLRASLIIVACLLACCAMRCGSSLLARHLAICRSNDQWVCCSIYFSSFYLCLLVGWVHDWCMSLPEFIQP